jgi:DNA polymerase-3 subunit epsilon
LETNGLSPTQHRIVEIATVQTDPAGRIVGEWTTVLNPEGPVGRTDIHGIAAADARMAPRFRDVAGELVSQLTGRALVAHNARFDLTFLAAEFGRAGYAMPDVPRLCTLEASWAYLPDLDRRRLVDCCWMCGVKLDDAHTALGDARATAHLLAHYLDPRAGLPPLAEHAALPQLASHTVWPSLLRSGAPLRPRTGVAARQPAAPGALWALLDSLPLSTMVDEGAPAASLPYLELLFQVFEDGVLTQDEATALADVAKVYSLTREQIHAAHGAFLIALAHRIVEDGKVTTDERDLLLSATRSLGFADDLPARILDEASAARQRTVSVPLTSVPAGLDLGEPLRSGQSIAFTGCDPLMRARLEGRAQAAGLRVTGSVSGRTVLLVTDGANATTRKAVAARERGVRTVAPAVFAYMVEHVLPADVTASSAAPEPAPAVPAPRQATDPATVRAWAAANGYRVGVRGRIASEVIAAYAAANGA